MGMVDLIDLLSANQVDYVLVKPKVSYAELRRDAMLVEVGPHRIPVASIDHLIEMKTGTGRGKDAVDIEALRKLKAGEAP